MVVKKRGTCKICKTSIMPTSTYCRRHAALARWGHTDTEQKKLYREEKKSVGIIKSFAETLPSEVTEVMKEVGGSAGYKELGHDLERIIDFAKMAETPPTRTKS